MPKQFVQNLLILFLFSFSCPVKTLAQIAPDNTLGAENSEVKSIDELRDRIEGGAIRGGNLFHSFSEFSVREGASVNFANPEGIVNIFSRVTGNNVSEIFGSLGVEGAANLFLMNPNGIIFGENSAVNVNGSFLATTAEDIKFDNGESFSASSPDLPLLTVNFPIGLGFGSDPGSINLRGTENNVVVEIPSFKVIKEDYTSGIKTDPGKNISLIGGNINFDGGGLQAAGGNIEIFSVGGRENIELLRDENWFTTDPSNVSQLRNIKLDNAAYIDTSNDLAGNIRLTGKNITLDKGSVVLANSSLSSNHNIDINATGLLELKGSFGNNTLNVFPKNNNISLDAFQGKSNFYSISLIGADLVESLVNQKSTGGNINVDAQGIRIADAGEIRTVSFSKFGGSAGDVNLNAEDISVSGTNNIDGLVTSVINSSTGIDSGGNSGNVNIITSRLQVLNGGQIKADTYARQAKGSGGKINIDAEQILLKRDFNNNSTPLFSRTGLSVSPGISRGSAGSINIQTKDLEIDNADINSSTFNEFGRESSGAVEINANQIKILNGGAIKAETAAGNAASIIINADNIELNGTRGNFADFSGGISTSTRFNSFGQGGNIQIKTNSLKIFNGAIVRAISLGSGDAGNINIDAESIEIGGVDRFALDPVASERVSKINTASLKSNGGNLTISSDSIDLDNFAKIQATSIQGNRGGNIQIDTDSLILSNQSNITASAQGQGNGGNITLDADVLAGLENSDITANAVGGKGGNIDITSDFIFSLESRNQLTPNSDITASSELGIDGTVTLNAPDNNLIEEFLVAAKDFGYVVEAPIPGSSCLNKQQERVQFIDLGGSIAPGPDDQLFDEEDFDDPVTPTPTTATQIQRDIVYDWHPGDPLIEANSVQTLPNGKKYLAAVRSTSPLNLNLCTRP